MIEHLRHAVEEVTCSPQTHALRNSCLDGLDMLSEMWLPASTVSSLLESRPAENESETVVSVWLENVASAVRQGLRPERCLVIKTMHLPHGVRELLPFDESTTLADVEAYLAARYEDTIRKHIVTYSDSPMAHAPLRLDFYDGQPRPASAPQPLDPSTRVGDLTAPTTDGVYWWPRSIVRNREFTPVPPSRRDLPSSITVLVGGGGGGSPGAFLALASWRAQASEIVVPEPESVRVAEQDPWGGLTNSLDEAKLLSHRGRVLIDLDPFDQSKTAWPYSFREKKRRALRHQLRSRKPASANLNRRPLFPPIRRPPRRGGQR